jgi:hypothetical protein
VRTLTFIGGCSARSPEVSQRSIKVLLAEIGSDMSRSSTRGRLTTWAGVCPGRRGSPGQTRLGQDPARLQMHTESIESAKVGAASKDSYLSQRNRQVRLRRGDKKAIVARPGILIAAGHVPSIRKPYDDPVPGLSDPLCNRCEGQSNRGRRGSVEVASGPMVTLVRGRMSEKVDSMGVGGLYV